MVTNKSNAIEAIARRILRIDTLKTYNCDGLDFHDVSVWDIRAALEAAYQAGRKSAGNDAQEDGE